MKNITCNYIVEKAICGIMIFSAMFVVIVSIIEPEIYKDVEVGLTYVFALIYIVILVGTVRFLSGISDKSRNRIIICCISAAFIIQMYIAFHMQLIPKVDLSHIYDQCVNMVESGNSKITDKKYFGFYTNNIPIAIIIYYIFRVGDILGITNYRLVGGISNVLLLFVMYYTVYLILKQITTNYISSVIMIILLTNPVFYAYASYYYTDTISLAFTMLSVYLLMIGERQCVTWKKIFSYMATGFIMGLAVQVRVTSIFIILAFFAFCILKKKWKKLFQTGIYLGVGAFLFMLLWTGVYERHVDFDTTNSSVTADHFVMMGSTGKGTYNSDDVKFTKSFKTREDKIINNRAILKKRIKENGIKGNLRLIAVKERLVWGVGARGYSQYTENVVKETKCYDIIVGEMSKYFRSYMQAYNIILFGMILLGCIMSLKNTHDYMLVLFIYWGGALIFYAFWEAHSRHSLSFLPLLTIMIVPFFEKIKENTLLREGRDNQRCVQCGL